MQNSWTAAINGHSASLVTGHKGFVCIKHFHESDLIVTKTKITLKKNAIPQIFPTSSQASTECNSTQIIENNSNSGDTFQQVVSSHTCLAKPAQSAKKKPAQPKQTNENCENVEHLQKCCDCSLYEILKAEYAILRQEFVELQAQKNTEIAKLECVKKKLISEAAIKKEQIKYLTGKIYQKEKSVHSLKILLKDLNAQSVLSTEAYEILEVN